jgi:AAA family ATP:ADP antiporter
VRVSHNPDRRAASYATATAAVLMAQQVAAKATRDGLFLSNYAASELPQAMLGGAILALITAYGTSRALSRLGPARVVPALAVTNALLFAAEWAAFPALPRLVAAVVYLHVVSSGASEISAFWSIVNERFDPHSAKRVVSRVGAAAAIGGLAGGLLAEQVSAWADTRSVLLALVVLGTGAAAAASCIGPAATPAGPTSGPPQTEATPPSYLVRIALLVMLVGTTSAVLDYVLKAQAARTYGSAEALTAFFAAFYTLVGAATFVFQAGAAGPLLQRLGLVGTLALLPGAVLLVGTAAAAVTRLTTAVAVKATDAVLSNSVFRSAYELLYTPLAEEKKRRTKVLIDVGADRAGEILGSGAVLGALLFFPSLPEGVLVGAGLSAAMLALLVTRTLRKGYIDALATSLRSNAGLLGSLDTTTRDTLTRSFRTLDRAALLARIEELRGPAGISSRAGRDDGVDRAEAMATPGSADLIAQLTALTSPDPETVRAALAAPDLDARLASEVIVLLGDDRLAADAKHALRRFRGHIAGLLTDALLDPQGPPAVRLRIPELLADDSSAQAALALRLALTADRFDVRYRSAKALAELVSRRPDLSPSAPAVEERVLWELEKQATGLFESGRDARALRRHVFALLGIRFDHQAMDMALQALETRDHRLVGTALEYLDNVLPDPLRSAVLPRLESKPQARRESRPSTDVLADLSQSLADYRIESASSMLQLAKGASRS